MLLNLTRVNEMQSESLKKSDTPSFSGHLVGARGAGAAQRAARAYHFPAMANNDHEGAGTPAADRVPAAEGGVPSARQPEHKALAPTVAEKPAARRLRKPILIGAAAVLLASTAGWFGYNYMTAG